MTQGIDTSKVAILLADVADVASLNSMCARATVLVNCCGPYQLYGEPVVKAAIDNHAHYLDISGEPQYIEKMDLLYNEAAAQAGVYVVSACGFDSIPHDMGVVYLQQNFGGTLNSVESYVTGELPEKYADAAKKSGILHMGTWESAIHSIANFTEIGAIRRKLFKEKLPKFRPTLSRRSMIHKNSSGQWCVPFLGVDADVIRRTQRHLFLHSSSRPAHFQAYVAVSSWWTALRALWTMLLLALTAVNPCTRPLLLKYPKFYSMGIVSNEGPNPEVEKNYQVTWTLEGTGWDWNSNIEKSKPDKKVVARVQGKNPGYGLTVVALAYSALTIIWEKNKLPSSGGVYTSGAAFQNTNLIKHLHENQLTFEILNSNMI